MSSLSNLPYGKILDYWFERLRGNKNRWKFVFTKAIEVYAFTKHKAKFYSSNVERKTLTTGIISENNIGLNPKISVVVPAYIRNEFEKHSLSRLIENLENQTYNIHEIIIIDDCSPVKYELSNQKYHFRQKTNGGPAKARNIGIDKALQNSCEIIVFTDVDCVPDKDWIKSIVFKYQKDKETSIVSGNTKSYNSDWFSTYHELNGTLNGRLFKNSDLLLYGTTSNLAITREVAENLRFNENFPLAAGEDIEFCLNAIKNGHKIKHSKNAIIKHDYGYNGNPIKNTKMFMNQFLRYAKGEKILLEFIPDYYNYFNETIEIQAN